MRFQLGCLELKTPASRAGWLSLLYSKRWILYAKCPFGGPQQVLRYLAKLTTHTMWRSATAALSLSTRGTSPSPLPTYRDNGHGSQPKELTLDAPEFIRRFSLHTLPSGLVRIRHYGILGSNRRKCCSRSSARAIFKCPRSHPRASAAGCRRANHQSLFGTLCLRVHNKSNA